MPRLLLLPACAFLALTIGCGSGDDTTAPPDDGTPGAGDLPADLLGEWRYEIILDQTCDPDTGLCEPTSAQSETLSFTDDGHFEHVFFGESNFPPCSMVVQHQSEGTAEVGGSTLALHISDGTTRVTDTCGENSTTDEGGETDTYTWELTQSNGSQQLLLTNDQGTELGPFERDQ
jgi:hypothetical protein